MHERENQTRMTLSVTMMDAVYDWKAFFGAALGLTPDDAPGILSGHTSTKGKIEAHEEAVHVFRFTRRCNLGPMLQDVEWDGATDESQWPYPADGNDVMLLAKHYVSSKNLCQPPMRFLPACVL